MYGELKEELRRELLEIRVAGLDKDERIISSRQGALVRLADGREVVNFCDGVRASKAKRFIYAHGDMADLARKLGEASRARRRIVATDGVFSMDGDIARGDEICDLAERHRALVMVDDSHATGFVGRTGRGTHERCGGVGRVDLITTTFGKALGGASGGCASGRAEIIEYLRQTSRPYLFSNTSAPAVLGATIAVIDLLSESDGLRLRLAENTAYFRRRMTDAGLHIVPGEHPIVPILLEGYENDARLAQDLSRDLLARGIYVIGFSYPVVPKGKARIRVQISAAHEREQLDRAIDAFTEAGRRYNVIH